MFSTNSRLTVGLVTSILTMSLVLLIVACSNDDDSGTHEDPITGTANQENAGDPHWIKLGDIPLDIVDLAIPFIADTHIDSGNSDYIEDNTKRAWDVVKDINNNFRSSPFAIHLGDMTNGNNTQYLVAFRQIFEDNYPGNDGGAIAGAADDDYDAYCDDTTENRIDIPVFPCIGNHDDPPFHYDSGKPYLDTDWWKAVHYISDRVGPPPYTVDRLDDHAYVVRYGKYVFIVLGSWAGSYNHEDKDAINLDKLKWLKRTLRENVGNSGLGVIICQHYGWEYFSTTGDWWDSNQRNLELRALLRNESYPSSQKSTPYNILAIMTGHNHGLETVTVSAGQDHHGNDINFYNFVSRSGGAEHHDKFGYSSMHLSANEMIIYDHELYTRTVTEHTRQITTAVMDEPDNFKWNIAYDTMDTAWLFPQAWNNSIMDSRPNTGSTEFGGGVASGDIDRNGEEESIDVVFAAIDSQPGAKRFYYRIGYNYGIQEDPPWSPRTFRSWGTIQYSPDISWDVKGAGADLADIDGNGVLDLVLMWVDDPPGGNTFRYIVGWNLDANGTATSWSEPVVGPVHGDVSQGAGVAVTDVDGDGYLDIICMAIDAPSGPNSFRYCVGFDIQVTDPLDTPEPSEWSGIIQAPFDLGYWSGGGGFDVADLDGNGQPEFIFVNLDDPEEENGFWCYIGWNIGVDGKATAWDDKVAFNRSGTPWWSAGAGFAIDEFYNFWGNPTDTLDFILMAVDDPTQGWSQH